MGNESGNRIIRLKVNSSLKTLLNLQKFAMKNLTNWRELTEKKKRKSMNEKKSQERQIKKW